ncbi:MAG: EamA family transporter [Hydrogenophaga sp.]|uniref:EamA family transporter n=1 Tax=Hydrogenophaga sp. TaxID=1904254 RepID=UPI0016B79BF3|nr:EamA family transporter [Hydrogenophaga sp.]NIM43081.1 EamA family transporter [Hydrogenophaga sp.]NIN28149.1 EamA family transporter [Hydrogenophaga sp.]NIN30587.1 EamA family transporter [Hydrogenophaga sp.]NIN57284.1 EamA family transporter [Hydrogenophaga sp.]NIO51503.1 EamA family transporter [Hydrogenophaga sp.]
MSLDAFLLVLLAGLIHAGWNIAAKHAGGDTRFAWFSSALIAVIWAPVGWWFARTELPRWGAAEWAMVVASGVIHVFYFTTLLRGYRRADLTVVYPLARGSGPLITALVAVLFLGERISALGAAGIAAVVGGVFLIAGGPGLWRAAHDPAARERVHRGLYYGALTGLSIAAYSVVDGYTVKVLLVSPIVLDYMGNLVRLVLFSPRVLRDRAEAWRLWRLQWRHALLVAVFSPVAYVLVLFAMQRAPLSHVAPAREVSMLFAALIGGHLLREGDRGVRLLGALCIGLGVAALALA